MVSVLPEIALELHAKQGVALETTATELLYGGAAGGGKSFLMRAAAVMWCGMIPGLQVYLFRRLRDDLVKNHIEGPNGLRLLLAPWITGGFCTIVEDEIRFWNGAKIYLCHCKDEKDRFKYLGAEIHVLLIDELTTFTDKIYRFLRSRVRMAGITVPPEMEGRFPRILCGSNPGNVGHVWVKAAFIDARPPLTVEAVPPSEGGMLRQYIPARLDDNPAIDPEEYGTKLYGLGSPALVKAMRDGDWNVVAGAFFPEWATDLHVVAPRSLPSYWQRFRSFDWGSARPFSVGWWAVSDGELAEFPAGALIRYREWYGAARDENGISISNTGLRLTAEEVADGIAKREMGDITEKRTMTGVADPAIFSQDGGPSIADRMAARKVYFRAADNARVGRAGAMGGWDQLRARLKGDGERPAMYVFSTCIDTIRTLPALQHDPDRPEDLDSEMEDHCFASGTLIRTPAGPVAIENLPPSGIVCTPAGDRPYRSAGLIKRAAETVRLTFSGGSTVECTPDHKFLIDTGEWIEAKDFLNETRYYAVSIGDRKWSLLSAKQSKSFAASVITSAVSIFRGKVNGCIALFGKLSTALSRVAHTFTTAISTRQTIPPTTSPALMTAITFPITGAFADQSQPFFWLNTRGVLRPSGTDLTPVLNGTDNTTMRTAKMFCTQESKWSALSVAPHSQAFPSKSSAPTRASLRGAVVAGLITKIASATYANSRSKRAAIRNNARVRASAEVKPLECVGLEFLSPQDVYCLTVPDVGCFLLDNGLIVSNCADEIRYAMMSRPYTAPLPAAATMPEPDRYARAWKPKRGRGSAMAA